MSRESARTDRRKAMILALAQSGCRTMLKWISWACGTNSSTFVFKKSTVRPGDNTGANGTFQKWTPLTILPELGSIPLNICPQRDSRVADQICETKWAKRSRRWNFHERDTFRVWDVSDGTHVRKLHSHEWILLEKSFNSKLSGNGVCCTNALLLLIKIMLCSKLHNQKN